MEEEFCETHFTMFVRALDSYPGGVTTGNDLKDLADLVIKECCKSHALDALMLMAEKDFRLYREYVVEGFEQLGAAKALNCLEMAEEADTDMSVFLDLFDKVIKEDSQAVYLRMFPYVIHFREEEILAHIDRTSNASAALLIIEL